MGVPALGIKPTASSLGLSEELQDIVRKLENYDFEIRREHNYWVVTYPEGDISGFGEVAFYPVDVDEGLLKILRAEEEQRDVLHRYQQFDQPWGDHVYGNLPDDTTIAAAGCGPTSLAIVLQYLMNAAPQQRNSSASISPLETATYAKDHGRVSGQGTAADPMIKGIAKQWPGFGGSKVALDEAVALLGEGKLIIWLCKGGHGWSRNRPLHRTPDRSYGGHYMVLAGVSGNRGPKQLFNVVDPGANAERAMRFTTYDELRKNSGGFWWVYQSDEPGREVCTKEG